MSNPDPPALCESVSSQAFELRDEGTLPPDEAGRLRAHLDACPHCRRESAWDGRLTALLRDEPLPPTPPGVADRVRRRLRRRLLRAGVAAAAALLLAVGLSWAWWPRPAARPDSAHSGNEANDLSIPPALFAGPPVDPLDVLARQQTAYLTALEQTEE